MIYTRLKKRRGSLLTETLLSLLIFSIGLLVLAQSMTFSLKGIVDSAGVISERQKIVSSADIYLLRRSIGHDNKASDEGWDLISHKELVVNEVPLKFKIYRNSRTTSENYDLYIAERND